MHIGLAIFFGMLVAAVCVFAAVPLFEKDTQMQILSLVAGAATIGMTLILALRQQGNYKLVVLFFGLYALMLLTAFVTNYVPFGSLPDIFRHIVGVTNMVAAAATAGVGMFVAYKATRDN